METTSRLPFQRSIDALICSATWEIDPVYAQSELNRYIAELDAVAHGVPFSELGYSERRASQLPEYLSVISSGRFSSSQNVASKKIVVLSLEGVMRSRDGLSSYGVNSLVNNLKNADSNADVGGVILKVNSGGGESIAGQMLQSAVRDMSKPVLVLADFMASAAVRGTLDAPYIWASSGGSEIGSIGTMVSINRQISEYYRANVEEIYAEQAADKNREWRDYLAGNRMPLIESLTESNEIFIQEAIQKRGIKPEALTGKTFTAERAKQVGLIDRIGTFKEAVEFLSGVILKQEQAPAQTGQQTFFNSLNSEQMNFDQFFQPFSAAWARITGRTLSSDNPLTPEALLQEAEALDVVARSEYEALADQLQAEKDRSTGLESAQASNLQRIAALEKELANEKANHAAGFQTEKQSGIADLDPVNPMAGFTLTPQTSAKY